MLELINHLPDNVVGVIGKGRIDRQDYETVFIPALETAIKAHKKVNIVYILEKDFTGYTPGAMWDDAEEGLLHLSSWGRIAIVCDITWLRNLSKAIGLLLPITVKTFNISERDEAIQWVCIK